jgi:hypothetical protein
MGVADFAEWVAGTARLTPSSDRKRRLSGLSFLGQTLGHQSAATLRDMPESIRSTEDYAVSRGGSTQGSSINQLSSCLGIRFGSCGQNTGSLPINSLANDSRSLRRCPVAIA